MLSLHENVPICVYETKNNNNTNQCVRLEFMSYINFLLPVHSFQEQFKKLLLSQKKPSFLFSFIDEIYKTKCGSRLAFIAPFDEINIISNVSGAGWERKNLSKSAECVWWNLTEDCFKLIDWLFYLKWYFTNKLRIWAITKCLSCKTYARWSKGYKKGFEIHFFVWIS